MLVTRFGNPGIVRVEVSEPFRISPRLLALALALALAALPFRAPAQEDLYGPQAPADVAYVRAVNALDIGGLSVRVADGSLESLPFGGATGYMAVAPGPVRLDLGGEELQIDAELGAFLTVAAHQGGAVVIEDTPLVDASRGLLALYNLSDRAALDLLVVDGPAVVEGVAPGTQQTVVVAEAEVALRVVSDAGDLVDLEPRLFERGVAHAVIVVSGPDGLVVGYAASHLDR